MTHTDHKLLIFLFLSTCQDLEVQVCTSMICYNNRSNDDLEFTTLLLLHFSWGEREIFLIDALLRERQKSPCYDLHLVNQAYSCRLLHLHILLKCTCLVLWTPWPFCSITICASKVSILSVLFKILLFYPLLRHFISVLCSLAHNWHKTHLFICLLSVYPK